MVSTFKLGSESIVLHLVLRYFQLQKPCQHLHRSNLVLYSSGLVTGKRSQKKHIEPARNATDATPFVRGDEKTGKPIILQKT